MCALLLCASPALAQTAPARPGARADGDRGHDVAQQPKASKYWFDKGTREYEAGDYAAAVFSFRKAYDRLPAPALLFNIAQALRLDRQCDEAIIYYEKFAQSGAQVPGDLEALRDHARKCADELKGSKGEALVETSHAGDKPSAESAPPDLPAETKVEPPVVRAPAVPPADLVAETGARLDKHSGRLSLSEKPSDVSAHPWTTTQWLGLGCFGVAIGSGVAGVILAKNAADAANRTSNASVWDSEAQENEADGKSAERWSVVSFGAALVTAGAGAWLFWGTGTDDDVTVSLGITSATLSTKF